MVKFSFVGDISLGEHYFSFGHGPKTYSENNFIFENIKKFFTSSNYVVANLECPISDLDKDMYDPESAVFRGHPNAITQLTAAGINIVSVANNHMLQHGEDVFKDTVERLKSNGIQVVGVANQEALVIDREEKIAIFACSDIKDNKYENQNLYQRWNENFQKKLKEKCKQGFIVIVFIHWGREDTHQPTSRQIEIENDMRELGVRIIVGHHPHIFYPIKNDANFICAYSLGDFVFDLPWDRKLLQTGIFNVVLEKSRMTSEIIPVHIAKNGCLPTATADPIALPHGTFDLYKHPYAVRFIQLKKLRYFLEHYLVGDTKLKRRFIINKLAEKISQP